MKHTMMKVLSVVMALTMIMGTFGMVVFATECEHENCAETKVPATCGTYGYTLYECEDCGYSYAANLIAKADECNPDSAVEIPAVEAQCGPNGHPAFTAGSYCSDCGAIVEEPEYIEGSEIACVPEVVLVPATCDKPYNEVKLVCSVCEYDFGSVNLDDEGFNNNLFDGDGEHNYVYEITVEPTCVKNGVAVVTCEQCDIEPIEIRVLKNDTLHEWVDVSVKNTCTTDGKRGFVCGNEGCDAVAGKDAVTGDVILGGRVETLYATGHTIVAPALDDLTDDCTAVEQAATCTKPGYTHWYCSNEGCPVYSKIQHEIIPASHQWPFTVVDGEMRDFNYDYITLGAAPDCVNAQVNTYRCMVDGCTATGTYTVPANGHNVNYAYSCDTGCAAGACNDCTHAGRTVTKTCLDCDAVGSALPDPKKPVSAAKHAWVYGDDVPGTCATLAYKTGYCDNAGCTQTLAAHAEEIPGSLNPENHEDTSIDRIIVTPPTCTKPGEGKMWCDACCRDDENNGADDDFITYVIPVSEHEPNIVISKPAQAATCAAAGWTKEEKCTVCEEIKTVSTPEAKLTECLPTTIVKDVMKQAGTCSTPAKWTAHCSVCGATYESVDGDKDMSNHVYFNEDGTTKTAFVYVPYKAPTCTTAGNHAYIACDGCDEVMYISEYKLGADVTFEDITAGFDPNGYEDVDVCDVDGCWCDTVEIAALGHDLVVYAAATETCTTPGMIGGEVCKRCDYKSNENAGKVIAPHGKFNGTSYEFDPNGVYTNANGETFYNYVIAEDVPATCTAEGERADNYCMICLKGQLDTHVIPKLAHDVQVFDVVVADCTNAGYTVYKCVNCDTIAETVPDATSATGTKEILCWYIDGYTKALGHDFTEVIDFAGDCVTASKTGLGCSRCEAETDVEYGEAPKGHKVGSEYVDLSCAGIAAYIGNICSECGEHISIDDMTHNIATGIEDATCTETGKLIYACVDCGLHFVDAEGSALTAGVVAPDGTVLVEDGTFAIEIPAYGHEIGLVADFVMPTKFTPGYIVFQCAVCGENMEAIELNTPVYESELGLNLEVSPYNSAIGKYEGVAVNTGKIAVTLTMDAAAFEYKILNLQFGFDTDALTFAGYTVNYEFEVTQAVETKAYATGDHVNVISRSTTPAAVEEVAPNVVIDGEDVEFITLFFTVKKDVFADLYYPVWLYENAIDFMVETEDGLVNKTATCDFMVDDEIELDVEILGDVSMDGEINLGDLVALTDLLYTTDAEYCPTADINRDGVINIVDIALLENYLLTNRTYDDYIAMVD